MPEVEIRKARQSGNSVVINLTGFAKPGQFFKTEREGNKIILTEVEIKSKEV